MKGEWHSPIFGLIPNFQYNQPELQGKQKLAAVKGLCKLWPKYFHSEK